MMRVQKKFGYWAVYRKNLRVFILLASGVCLSACGFYQTNPAPVINGWRSDNHVSGFASDSYSGSGNSGVKVTPLATTHDHWQEKSFINEPVVDYHQTILPPPTMANSPNLTVNHDDSFVLASAHHHTKDGIVWQWPTSSGHIVQGFSASNKGIEISGKIGQPIYAAAAGTVLYAGNGLTGYGKLLIIKHNDQLLSAYAHNSVLLVKEGAMVKRGQKIALMGNSGLHRVGLHFEIRHNRRPVEPTSYLGNR